MREIIECITASWSAYWGESRYVWLLCAAFVCLAIFGRKNEAAKDLIRYQILMTVVYFCPVTAAVVQKCVGALVYWRVIWLFPVAAMLSYAAVLIIQKEKKRILRFVWMGVFVCLIMFSGKSVWQAGNYEITANRQQVPDEVAQIGRMILENRTSQDSLVAADDHVASYLRVYDASIKMVYGRRGDGAASKRAFSLYENVVSPEPDYQKITEIAQQEGCEFLIFRVPQESVIDEMEECRYKMIGSVEDYVVFQDYISGPFKK